MRSARDPGLVAALIAIVLAVAASSFFAFAPSTSTSSSVTVNSSGDPVAGTTVVRRTTNTLLENEGTGVLPVLAVPILLALGAAVVTRARLRRGIRFALAWLLLLGCLVGAASVGLFYVPAAAALLWCAIATPQGLGNRSTSPSV